MTMHFIVIYVIDIWACEKTTLESTNTIYLHSSKRVQAPV